jgi:hypothetical protein
METNKEEQMKHYTDDQIQAAKVLLETLEVSGLENCKRVVMLRQILDGDKPENEEEANDGAH